MRNRKSIFTSYLLLVVLLLLVTMWPSGIMQRSVSAQSGHQVSLKWSAPVGATGLTGYNVKRGTTPGTEVSLTATIPASSTSFDDTTGTGGVTYFYVVTAVYGAQGESIPSNEVSATFLVDRLPPTGLAAVSN